MGFFNIKTNRIDQKIRKINALEETMKALTDDQMKAKTEEFKERYHKGESLDSILPEAFALVREASRRVLGYGHYDVQLKGGIALHEGYVAEMKTGEGKTLVSTAPAYLNALTGNGVHVVTVNDYLAERDADWMGQIHRHLGLSVGCVLSGMTPDARKKAYECDITYVTNSELGFDYLRDNMATSKQNMVLRGLKYCIIDEADSVLIDEARTPLIISGAGEKVTKLYDICDILVKQMKKGDTSEKFSKALVYSGGEIEETGDFIIDEENQTAYLTEEGVRKAEEFFGLENFSDPENTDIRHHIVLALKAHFLMKRDIDYIVSDGEVKIVDEFTGRVMEGRRYSDGLHQAIEAKEHVKVNSENRTMATITLQNFFNKYDKKSGMTGTAETEKREFRNTYGMDVLKIPTNRPVLRDDRDDLVYKTKQEKYNAVLNEIKDAHKKGQPVLVGTTSIETSEHLSMLLKKEKITHQVLNAKFDKEEADIVEKAGEFGAVTIATNMAGRGTDIKLDARSKEVGGLKVIGTERHESRRIDDQLRGRSGRQGDPGDSRFFLSLEDELFEYNGPEKMTEMLKTLKTVHNEPISYKKMSEYVKRSQEKVEFDNFGIRESLLDYDKVNNVQRESVYGKRMELIENGDIHEEIMEMYEHVVSQKASAALQNMKDTDYEKLDRAVGRFTGKPITKENYPQTKKPELVKAICEDSVNCYKEMIEAIGNPERFYGVERFIYLKVIDSKWVQHLADMEKLKEVIILQAIGQKDPVVEYRLESSNMFEKMLDSIESDVIEALNGMRKPKQVD